MMQNKLKNYLAKKDMPAMVVLGGGILLAVFVFILVQRLEFRNLKNQFIFDTENYSAAIDKSIEDNLNVLHALEGLYASSPKVTRARFHAFVGNILPHRKGLYSLRWVPRVPGSERRNYEAAAVRDGLSSYHIVELKSHKLIAAGKRNEYFPVYYSGTVGNNEAALGLDMAAHSRSRISLEKARDSGSMVVTRRITLVLEPEHQFAFLALQPIYRNGLPHDTVDERRENLLGFVVGVFRLDDMVATALKGINLNGIELSLSDEMGPPDRRNLFSNVQHYGFSRNNITSTRTLNVADRYWTITFYSTQKYLSAHRTRYSYIILAAGLLFTSLLSLYVFKMKRNAFDVERSKDTMSAVLNSINSAIAIIDTKDMTILSFNRSFIQDGERGGNEIIGRRCKDVLHKRALLCNRRCDECPVTLTMRTGMHTSRESIHRGVLGRVTYIEISAYPVKDESGEVLHAVYVAQDITSRKQAENTRLEEQQIRRISAEREVVATQLRMLQAQIEPHFLFNTLANVISFIDGEPKTAKAMLQHLTNALRRALERTRQDVSTLEQELDMLKDYLSILKMRLGSRLEFRIDIPKGLLKSPVPPMLLQPLVENAIKHGIEPKVEGGTISIAAERMDGRLRLSVSDTGLGFSEKQINALGVGIGNVKARLQALYGTDGGLILEENLPCGMTAIIEVPL